jgi:hypothetical protein
MKSAEEIRNIRKRKLEERLKENQNRINEELLECEKALNKYEDDIEDTKLYVQVPLIIKTKEVKTLLEQQGYYIDKTNQDIPVNTTRIYLDKESYDIATRRTVYQKLADSSLDNKSIQDKAEFKDSDNIKMYINGHECNASKSFNDILDLILSKQKVMNRGDI